MKVSVITVVYNAKTTIEQTINSVLLQSYKNIEYIIIDGGSTDGTLDIIAKYRDKLAYFVSEPDGGIYDAMNKGIQKTTGDIIGLLNADDLYEPCAIENVVKKYECSNSQIIVGKTWVVDKEGNKKLRRNDSFDNLWRRMCACHQAVFIAKSAYNTFGLYDTQYKITADYELLLRMYHGGVKVSMIDDVLVNYGSTGISSTSFIECAQEFNAIIKKYVEKYPGKEEEISELCSWRLRSAKMRYMLERYPLESQVALERLGIFVGKKIVLWGTGIWGQRIFDVLFKNSEKIAFFVDSNESKWDTLFNGIPVKSPDSLKDYNGVVFIAVKDYDVDIKEKIDSFNNHLLRCIMFREFIESCSNLYDDLCAQIYNSSCNTYAFRNLE